MKYHYNCKWNLLIICVQKIWCSSFLLDTFLISIRTVCFPLDNSLTLSSTPNKSRACLTLYTAVDIASQKRSMLKVHWVCNCQIIMSDMGFLSLILFNSDITSFLWLETTSAISLINDDCHFMNLSGGEVPSF